MHPERVHIVPLRGEHDRAVEPLLAERADRVHLLPHDGADGTGNDDRATGDDAADRGGADGAEGPTAVDAVARELRAAGVEVAVHPVDQFDVYAVFGLVTTLATRHAEDAVYVNVSTGTRLAAIGAALGCMDVSTEATPYHAAGEHDPGHGPRDAAPPESGSGGGQPVATYPVDSLTRSQVAALAVVAVEDDDLSTPTKRRLIDRLVELELALDGSLAVGARIVENADGVAQGDAAAGFDDLDANDRKSAYRTLDSVALGRLTEEGHVTVSDAGRSKQVELTEQGENALRAFRHKVTDVVRELDGPGMPAWLQEGL